MDRRSLGQDGTTVSAIGLGCMGMSEFYGSRDDAQSLDTLAAALEHGVDFLDTADMYGSGHNEELVGRFLKGRRDQVVLATKFGIVREPGVAGRRVDNSPAYIRAAAEASLKRLGTDVIDLYYMHRRNPAVPVEDAVGAMAGLVQAGKVRQIGLSEVSAETLRRAHGVHPIAAVQSEYSLWTRDAERNGVIEACRELGTTFVAYSPLGRAFLAGAVTDTSALAADDFRRVNPRFADGALAQNTRLVEALSDLAFDLGAKPAQVALAWLLAKHDNVVPIPGTKRRAYLAENAAAAAIRLTAEQVSSLDVLFAPEAVAGARYNEAGMKDIGL
ncbi:aldo/keto reductase [Mycobacterium sp. KBS0706]|uniref:aldo/keto reductase n=1 Tax=Mycobacterium sp. KBS0706 TaxID=2578109 RepID=UPI00110FEF13|nr:aldo/keto reductase [Mycobacterium sp. KBS0706]TSD83422.1 aldo/keto reductase [Mycobacterium sp. KBS0706]